MSDDVRGLFLTAFAKHDVPSDLRAGIAAICGGESELSPKTESSYRGTAAHRLRDEIFKSRLRNMSDAEIDALKVDDPAFFEQVYGGMLGNDLPGDGFKYRGRGLNQLTGKTNYARYGKKIGVDLLGNPERVNELPIAVEVAVVYMLDRYHGGGWEKMKEAVGNSFGAPDHRKNELFAEYTASGEWDAAPPAAAGGGGSPPGTQAPAGPDTVTSASPSAPAVTMEPVEAIRRIQRIMQAAGVYVGRKVDGAFGQHSLDALDELLRKAGQSGFRQ